MKRRLFVSVCLLLLLRAAAVCPGCSGPQAYSPAEVETLLHERYGLTFTVDAPLPGGADTQERIFPATCMEFPDLPFEAAEAWYPAGWSGGSDGVPPLPHGSRHVLRDSFRTASWNRYAVPLLRLSGITGAEIPAEQRFSGVDFFAEALCDYRILLSDDIDTHTETLYTLLRRLDSLPAFQSYTGTVRQSTPEYGVPVTMAVADGIGNTTRHLRLAVGYGYEKEALAALLETLQRTVRNNLLRELERSGVLPSVLARMDIPIIGSDFLFLPADGNGAFSGIPSSIRPAGGWLALLILMQEHCSFLPETLSLYPAVSLAGRSWHCVSGPPAAERQDTPRFCIDCQTGDIWQYAPYRGDIFLVRTGSTLPAAALTAFPQPELAAP